MVNLNVREERFHGLRTLQRKKYLVLAIQFPVSLKSLIKFVTVYNFKFAWVWFDHWTFICYEKSALSTWVSFQFMVKTPFFYIYKKIQRMKKRDEKLMPGCSLPILCGKRWKGTRLTQGIWRNVFPLEKWLSGLKWNVEHTESEQKLLSSVCSCSPGIRLKFSF